MKTTMKRNIAKLAVPIFVLALSLTSGFGQSTPAQSQKPAAQSTKSPAQPTKPATQTTTPSATQASSPQKSSRENSPKDLEAVLSQMDKSSEGFRNAQA